MSNIISVSTSTFRLDRLTGDLIEDSCYAEVEMVADHMDPLDLDATPRVDQFFQKQILVHAESEIRPAEVREVGYLSIRSQAKANEARVEVSIKVEDIFKKNQLYAISFDNTSKRLHCRYVEGEYISQVAPRSQWVFGDPSFGSMVVSSDQEVLKAEHVAESEFVSEAFTILQICQPARVTFKVPASQVPMMIHQLGSFNGDPGREVFNSDGRS